MENEKNTLEVGEGSITTSLTSYSDHELLEGFEVSLFNHGASTAGVKNISIKVNVKLRDAEKASDTYNATISWGDKIYYYRNADLTEALAIFTVTQSLGKTANAIKASGTLNFVYEPATNTVSQEEWKKVA